MDETLLAAERRLQAAQLAGDVGTLDELLDECVRFTFGTVVSSKADDLAAHRAGTQRLTSLKEESLDVFTTGPTGVTWLLAELSGYLDGSPFTARLRYTRTWHKGPAGWRVIAAHASHA
ncbi:MAG TPA: nuclear transport factor 2 family protein [Amycolatopsis sp.]|jgi:ketosteroid isomerase-like protein|nr:nuclear transport factor 2 family protein [Amycolatopsis sp.]